MDGPQVTYLYDGTFSGFLTCVFHAYRYQEPPASFCAEDQEYFSLFPSRSIITDQTKAKRVYRSLEKAFGNWGRRLICDGFLTCLEEKEMWLWRYMEEGYRRGPSLSSDLTNPSVHTLSTAVKHLRREAHQFTGFVRFSQHQGTLVSRIAPKNQVLPLLQPHFCSRYPQESFLIFDSVHHQGLISHHRQWAILSMDGIEPDSPEQEELDFRQLWRVFYHTISIQERYNPSCRNSHMPMRYWENMTEFQTESVPAHALPYRP